MASITGFVVNVTAELLARHDRPGPRYTSYPTALDFSAGFTAEDVRKQLARVARGGGDVSLYVHFPFCQSRCRYCACLSIEGASQAQHAAYIDALTQEMRLVAEASGTKLPVAVLHWGGGTPTHYELPTLLQVLHRLREHFAIRADAELSLEADPRVTSVAHLEALAAAGFRRISLGVQDFDPDVQAAIGRIQPREQTAELITAARAAGFRSINLDLVYGLPQQNPTGFSHTLDAVIDLRPERVALYSFAYLPWAQPLHQFIAPETLPSADTKIQLLAAANQRFQAAGYQAIGMDHFALPDDAIARAQREGRLTRTFMGYSVAHSNTLIGLGLSAISYLFDAYAQNTKNLEDYLSAIANGRLPTARGLELSAEDLLRAHVIRELMCNFQIHIPSVEARFHVDWQAHFATENETLQRMAQEGFLTLAGGTLRLTPLGRIFVRNVAMTFDTYLQRHQAQNRFSRTI